MTLTTSPHPDLPQLRFPADLRLTPDQFELLCAENRDAVLELAADGRVIAMTPTGSETGARNGELFFQLKLYAKRTAQWKAFDSSTGFQPLPSNPTRLFLSLNIVRELLAEL